MATPLLAATTAAANTIPIVVSATTGPVTVVAVCASKIDFDYRAVLKVLGGSVYQDVFDPDRVQMGKHRHALVLQAYGTYILAKDATDVAVGFESTP